MCIGGIELFCISRCLDILGPRPGPSQHRSRKIAKLSQLMNWRESQGLEKRDEENHVQISMCVKGCTVTSEYVDDTHTDSSSYVPPYSVPYKYWGPFLALGNRHRVSLESLLSLCLPHHWHHWP